MSNGENFKLLVNNLIQKDAKYDNELNVIIKESVPPANPYKTLNLLKFNKIISTHLLTALIMRVIFRI